MTKLSTLLRPLSLALGFSLLGAPVAAMAEYPNKPIQLIVPWAAGGGSDSAARGIATAL